MFDKPPKKLKRNKRVKNYKPRKSSSFKGNKQKRKCGQKPKGLKKHKRKKR